MCPFRIPSSLPGPRTCNLSQEVTHFSGNRFPCCVSKLATLGLLGLSFWVFLKMLWHAALFAVDNIP